MIFLKLIGKLIKALKSEESPEQMGWGFALGIFLGFMPANTLFLVLIFFILFIFKVNFASAMLAFAVTSLFAVFLDPLFHELGFVACNHPRFQGTLKAIESVLKKGNHLFRYINADDFGVPETAFTVCTFWYIEASALSGRRAEAREMFERILSCRTKLGLLSEDVDPRTGELWGNFPQTYSMVGLIKCAMRLSDSWEEAF